MTNEIKIQDIKKIINHELREYYKYIEEPATRQLIQQALKSIDNQMIDRIRPLTEQLTLLQNHLDEQLKQMRELVNAMSQRYVDRDYFAKTINNLQLYIQQTIQEMRGMLVKDSNQKTGLDKPINMIM